MSIFSSTELATNGITENNTTPGVTENTKVPIEKQMFYYGIAFAVFGAMCFAAALVIHFERQLRGRCKPFNDQIENKEVSLVSASENEVENPAPKEQILIESIDEDEHDFMENKLYNSSESFSCANEVQQFNSEESHKSQKAIQTKDFCGKKTSKLLSLNEELEMKFQNSNALKLIIRDRNAEVTNTSIGESCENISYTPQILKVDDKVYDNYDNSVQGTEIEFRFPKSASNTSNQKLSPEINKSVPMEEGDNTNFQETQPEIDNRNDEGHENRVDKIDKTRSFIDEQNISEAEFSSDDNAYTKQKKNSSKFHKQNSNSNTERLEKNRIYNKQKDITSAHSNDEETLLSDNGNEASLNEKKTVSNPPHRWVTQHSSIYHDNPSSPTNKYSSNSDEDEFVDNSLYGHPGDIILESDRKSQGSRQKDNFDQRARIDLDNAPSIPKECVSYSDKAECVDNILYAFPEEIISDIKNSHGSGRGDFAVPHPDEIPSTHKECASNFDEEDEHQYEDPEEMLKDIEKSIEPEKRDLISYPSIYPDKVSSTQKKCASYFDEENQYDDLEEVQEAVRNSHIHPHPRIHQEGTSSTANECTRDSYDEEFVDNVLYGDPGEIMRESGKHSLESEKKHCVDSHECPFDKEEFVDDNLYDDAENILESGTKSLDSVEKDCVDSYSNISPENLPSTPEELTSYMHQDSGDGPLYDDAEGIMLETEKHPLV